MKQRIEIVKIGGKIMDNAGQLHELLNDFSSLEGPKILVHGGGNQASGLAKRMNITTKLENGRRITDRNNLDIAVMVYAGLLNKSLVSKLQSLNVNALGLSGADLNSIKSTRRNHPSIDFGEVGDISTKSINSGIIHNLLENGITPVFCAITHDGNGNLLNTNADTIASVLAIALANYFVVNLTFCFEYKGVLRDSKDPGSWMDQLSYSEYQSMLKNGMVSEGMLPKLENAFNVLKQNVNSVKIKSAKCLNSKVGTELNLN